MAVDRVIFRVLVVLILCVLLSGWCGAVDMEVMLGFDGAAKSSYWTPIAVTLHNTGADKIVGSLSATQQDFGAKELPTYSANVIIPPHSRKLYHLYARLAEYGGDMTVALSDGHHVVVSRKVTANTCSPKDIMVVSVGPRTTRPNYLMGDTVKIWSMGTNTSGMPGSKTRDSTITVGSIEDTRLPDRPAALEGVDCLILSDFRPSAVPRKALSAICSWVASGGILVVTTGPDYRKFTHGFYKELLPVKIEGAANVPDLDALTPFGKAKFPAGPIAICQAELKKGIGRAWASRDGLPIIATRDYGAGRVVFVAVDHFAPPFRDWSGQAAFWKSLISLQNPGPIAYTEGLSEEQIYGPSYGGQMRSSDSLIAVVEQNPSIKAPSYGMLTAFLAIYLLILAPVNYAVLRKKRRLELAWVTTPAIVLVFSIGAYVIGWTIKGGGLRLCEASIVESSSSARYARAVTVASLFSPAKRRYNVEVRDPSAVCQVLGSDESERQPRIVAGQVNVIEELPANMWSSKGFQSVGGMDLGGRIVSRLVTDGRSVSGSISNETKVPLENCCLVYGGNKVELRNLPCGGSVDVKAEFLGSRFISDYIGEHPSLARKLREQAIARASGLGVPVLIGVARTDKTVFELAGESPEVESAAVCVFRLDYTAGRTFAFGPDQIITSVVAQSYGPEENGAFIRPGESANFVFGIIVPPGGKITSLSVKPDPPSIISSTILNRQTQKWEPLPGGAITDVGRYLNAAGTVRVRATNTGAKGHFTKYNVNASGVRE